MQSNNVLQEGDKILLICDEENNSVTLPESNHLNHEYFISLAKLHKTKFVQSIERDEKAWDAQSVVYSIIHMTTGKGRGKIYLNYGGEWIDGTEREEMPKAVFAYLLRLFGVSAKVLSKHQEHLADFSYLPPLPKKKRSHSLSPNAGFPTKKLARYSLPPSLVSDKTHNAAQTLARMSASTTFEEQNDQLKLKPVPPVASTSLIDNNDLATQPLAAILLGLPTPLPRGTSSSRKVPPPLFNHQLPTLLRTSLNRPPPSLDFHVPERAGAALFLRDKKTQSMLDKNVHNGLPGTNASPNSEDALAALRSGIQMFEQQHQATRQPVEPLNSSALLLPSSSSTTTATLQNVVRRQQAEINALREKIRLRLVAAKQLEQQAPATVQQDRKLPKSILKKKKPQASNNTTTHDTVANDLQMTQRKMNQLGDDDILVSPGASGTILKHPLLPGNERFHRHAATKLTEFIQADLRGRMHIAALTLAGGRVVMNDPALPDLVELDKSEAFRKSFLTCCSIVEAKVARRQQRHQRRQREQEGMNRTASTSTSNDSEVIDRILDGRTPDSSP